MRRPEPTNLTLQALNEGREALEKLKKVNVPACKTDVAMTLHNIRHALQGVDEAQRHISERHTLTYEGTPIPACKPETDEEGRPLDDLDPHMYRGEYDEERTYANGECVLHQNKFYRAVNPGTQGSEPGSEDWKKVGTVAAGSSYVKDVRAYQEELNELAAEEHVVNVHKIPAEVLDEIEDVTPEMIWIPMLEWDEPEVAKNG